MKKDLRVFVGVVFGVGALIACERQATEAPMGSGNAAVERKGPAPASEETKVPVTVPPPDFQDSPASETKP